LPGEKDPTQAISVCPYCGASVSQDAQECQSCHMVMTPIQGGPHPRKVPQKGERYKDYGPKLDFVSNVVSVASSKQTRRKDKNKDHAKHDEDTVKDEYTSDEFRMCVDPKRKMMENVDVRKEEIMRSCTDLAIDG